MKIVVNPIGKISSEYISKVTTVCENLWKNYVKPDWPAVVHFLLLSIEAGAKELDKSGLLNEDKKATLIASAGVLYDNMIAGMLPIYLRPFNSYIKQFLVSVVLNVLVDYVVDKVHQLENLENSKTPISEDKPNA